MNKCKEQVQPMMAMYEAMVESDGSDTQTKSAKVRISVSESGA